MRAKPLGLQNDQTATSHRAFRLCQLGDIHGHYLVAFLFQLGTCFWKGGGKDDRISDGQAICCIRLGWIDFDQIEILEVMLYPPNFC